MTNPFNPSYPTPPFLAGREGEQTLLQPLVVGERHRSPVGVIFGPRGNGKSSLARWLREALLGRGIPTTLVPGPALSTPTATGEILFQTERNDNPMQWLDALGAGEPATRTVIVDEAQSLSADIADRLLVTAELSEGRLSVVFVGTPKLPDLLREANASLWAKGPVVRVERLARAAARDALAVPMRGGEREFEPAVLDAVVDATYGYPPFVQCWGFHVWQHTDAGEVVTPAVQRRASAAVGNYIENFYDQRKAELATFWAAAHEVSLLFDDRDAVADTDIVAVIAATFERGAADPRTAHAFVEFRHRGLIWADARDPTRYRAAIPSLMASIREAFETTVLASLQLDMPLDGWPST